jgi:Flp pilus assembly pilin Flp
MSLILYARLHGANLTEYAMILGLFVLLLAGTLAPFGKNFNDLFEALVDPIALASGETATALGGGPFEGVTPFPTEGTVSEVRPMKGPIALDDKNTLYYRVDPATGQLVLNIKQPGQPGQNTTSMEGSEVMEQLAKRLDAMAQASQTSGRPMSVRETMRLRQLAAQARVLAQYQERIDQRKANGQPINTHLLQGNLFSGLLGSYNRFNTR